MGNLKSLLSLMIGDYKVIRDRNLTFMQSQIETRIRIPINYKTTPLNLEPT